MAALYLYICEMADGGWGIDRKKVMIQANAMVRLKRGGPPLTDSWYNEVLCKRYPDLARLKAQNVGTARKEAMNKAVVKDYFDKASAAHKKAERLSGGVPLTAERIWGSDECGKTCIKFIIW